jgi:hypothetical protein
MGSFSGFGSSARGLLYVCNLVVSRGTVIRVLSLALNELSSCLANRSCDVNDVIDRWERFACLEWKQKEEMGMENSSR